MDPTTPKLEAPTNADVLRDFGFNVSQNQNSLSPSASTPTTISIKDFLSQPIFDSEPTFQDNFPGLFANTIETFNDSSVYYPQHANTIETFNDSSVYYPQLISGEEAAFNEYWNMYPLPIIEKNTPTITNRRSILN